MNFTKRRKDTSRFNETLHQNNRKSFSQNLTQIQVNLFANNVSYFNTHVCQFLWTFQLFLFKWCVIDGVFQLLEAANSSMKGRINFFSIQIQIF